MSYRVEYNGTDVEISTLDAAVETAKQAIMEDVGPVSGWTIEHDDAINDWFIQGVLNGSLVGATAVVTGPEPVMSSADRAHARGVASPSPYRAHRAPDVGVGDDIPVRSLSFTGISATEVFGKATTWLAGRADVVDIDDVAWHVASAADPYELRVYYRAG